MESISAMFYRPNSPVAHSNAAADYIWNNCRRISEKRAREIHPRLFEYLEK